jgi:hypothetical protein
MGYKRVTGGEKNLNSGVRWTKDEIIQVYHLYKKVNGVGLHEHNPAIQELAAILGRTVRSTEAQTLMFRNLERSGVYSHGNMNKLSKEVWIEFEVENKKTSTIKVDSGKELFVKGIQSEIDFTHEDEEDDDIERALKYSVWNEKLVNHFFNENYSEIEIGCLPVSEELFQVLSDYAFTFEDFIYAIRVEISSNNFLTRLEKLHKNSLPREHNGRSVRKPIPDYFGMLMFLILALSEDEGENMSVANVYDRVNNYGQHVFNTKWSDLTSSVARDVLEPIWASLEDWSTNYLKAKKGSFVRRNPKSKQRKYVSRLERHSLFNSRQFTIIIDLLIADGARPENILSPHDWISFFKKHKEIISQATLILEYISEGSPLQNSVVSFLNNYLKQHFTSESIASEKGIERKPPLRLKLCFKSIPTWPEDPIENIYYRVFSEHLHEDTISHKEQEFELELENKEYSNIINPTLDLEIGGMLSGKENRYMSSKGIYWLGKNHELNEWVEVDYPTNEQVFILVGAQNVFAEIIKEGLIKCSQYTLVDHEHVAVRFKNLDEESFSKVYHLYNPFTKIEGKIELISEFTSERRRCIYKEFNPRFRYIGPSVDAVVVAVSTESNEQLTELIPEEREGGKYYKLPTDFHFDNAFQLKEKGGKIKSRYNLYFGDLNSNPKNIRIPCLKDHEGINQLVFERKEKDILDIPQSFNRDFDVRVFNGWYSKLFRLFNGVKNLNAELKDSIGTELFNSKGDLLLQFTALNENITTYDFPKLIRELDPSISIRFSKVIMAYWRNLGYINFQDYGEAIKVNPTSIMFLQTEYGLKGYLAGYRNEEILNQLKSECKALHIEISMANHATYKNEVYPSKVILFDKRGRIDKFQKLKENMDLHFVNDIQNALNPRYVVYQLACLYTQRSIQEFKSKLDERVTYEGDHHRKRVYDANMLRWVDTIKNVELFEEGTVVRYEGFRDKSMIHIIRYRGVNKIINDVSLGVFSTLSENVLMKRESETKVGYYNLLVPFFLGLPFWIERGLVLLNAELPDLESNKGISYRLYRDINERIIEVLELKLDQKITEL